MGFEDELDQLTTRILVPLRGDKTLDVAAIDVLCTLLEDAQEAGLFDDQIPVKVAGKLWFIFSAMLTEADHARDPEPIRRQAWRYEWRLLRAFGM